MKSWIKVLLSITVLFGLNAAQALELYGSPNGRDQGILFVPTLLIYRFLVR